MITGIDEEQKLFIKIVRARDANDQLFTAYLLLTEDQNDLIEKEKKLNFNTYEIIYEKLGLVTKALHEEILLFFCIKIP